MVNSLIIFDIDETLYNNHEKHIPNSTLVALEKLKEAGHTLAIATGRAPFELVEAVKTLPFDFFILANGQLVLQGDTVIYENAIEKEILHEILKDAKEAGVHIGFNSATHSSVTGLTPKMRVAFEKYYEIMPEISDCIKSHGAVYQMWYLSEDMAVISEKFKNKLRFLPWLSGGADVIPTGASKAIGLMKALEFLEILPQKTIFFGDGMNDIELMEMADIGVAMGNAVAPLKKVADFVTKNIEDDGIYHACQQLGLFGGVDSGENDIDEYIEQLKSKIKDEPYELKHYLHLKSLYSNFKQDLASAIEVLNQALPLFSNNTTLLLELATIYEFEVEDDQQAKIYYEKVLKLDPNNQLALIALASHKPS